MFGKTKWYRKAFTAYRKKKLDEPYRSLLRYYMAVGFGTPIARFDGHYDYFISLQMDDEIVSANRNLREVLPEHLYENYRSALEAFESLGEEPEYEVVMAAFEKQDDYVFEHYKEIEKLLIDYVNEMKK